MNKVMNRLKVTKMMVLVGVCIFSMLGSVFGLSKDQAKVDDILKKRGLVYFKTDSIINPCDWYKPNNSYTVVDDEGKRLEIDGKGIELVFDNPKNYSDVCYSPSKLDLDGDYKFVGFNPINDEKAIVSTVRVKIGEEFSQQVNALSSKSEILNIGNYEVSLRIEVKEEEGMLYDVSDDSKIKVWYYSVDSVLMRISETEDTEVLVDEFVREVLESADKFNNTDPNLSNEDIIDDSVSKDDEVKDQEESIPEDSRSKNEDQDNSEKPKLDVKESEKLKKLFEEAPKEFL